MACFTLFLLLFILGFISATSSTDHCSTSSCNPSRESYSVHFPFRLPKFQPKTNCGYSQDFTLSCSTSPLSQTLIYFDNSGTFAVQSIFYSEQTLYITDPNNCLPQRFFHGFNISASPFRESYGGEYTYYNCTRSGAYLYSTSIIGCMSSLNYAVIALRAYAETLPNCTVIKSVWAPVQEFGSLAETRYLKLYWYDPSCELCIERGGVCGFFKGGSVGCHETKGHGLTTGAKFGVILGISIPGFLILLIAIQRCSIRSETTQEQQPATEAQLIRTQQTVVLAGLDAPTIESYPKFILGLGDALLESSTGPCAICLSEYKLDDTLRTIPDCNHYFHSDCVDEWLKLKATCPVCRKTPDA